MSKPQWMTLVTLALLLGAALGARPAAPPANPAPLAVAGRGNAFVSLASRGAWTVAAWAASLPDASSDIFAAVSRDGGKTFGSPVRVNDTPGMAKVGGEQPPRVALAPARAGATPLVTVVWTAKGTPPAGTRLLSATSSDAGRTFSPAALVPGSDAIGNRGWESAAAAAGGVGVLWLDHRDMVRPAGAAAHKDTADPAAAVAMAQQSSLYFALLGGGAQAITPGVCYCCKTALAMGPGGAVVAAWRQVYAGDFRDIAFTISRDGGRTFAPPLRVHSDQWMIDGCPEDGPALAIEPRGRIDLVWPTQSRLPDGSTGMVLNFATSSDGRQFAPPVPIPAGASPHHPVIALDPQGRPWIAWDEAAAMGRQVALARATVDARGQASFAPVPLPAPEGTYPALAPGLAAWTSGPPDHTVIHLESLTGR